MKTMRIVIAVALFAVMATALPAGAASIVQNQAFDGVPNYLDALTFNQFDSSLGTLNSITVTFDLAINGGYLTVDNDGVDPATVSVALGATGHITSNDVTLLDGSFQPVVPYISLTTGETFNLGANSGDGVGNVDSNGPDGATHLGGAADDWKTGTINSTFFNGFTGTGTYNINANIDQYLSFGGVGGVEGAFSPVASEGNLTIVYDYTPVPEPASMLALLAGLGGLAGFARKRKK